jgi:8-amino-7-oxononanoate synthase
MSGSAGPSGLDPAARAKLLSRLGRAKAPVAAPTAVPERPPLGDPGAVRDQQLIRNAGALLGIEDTFFRTHDGLAGATTRVGGRVVANYASYDYLGLNGHPRITAAAKAAIDRYGTTVSASRIVSGERSFHRELERALANIHGAEDSLAFVSGHATNVSVIGSLIGPDDAVIYDELAHNSIYQGAVLSRAQRIAFAHNDLDQLDAALAKARRPGRRLLVVVEGHYSMDGDAPDLAGVVAAVRRHGAWLMVDEAHSLGVLGRTGAGVAERCGVDPRDVDLWMGTLSKALVSSGGYVAGAQGLIDYLRGAAPGFIYSVGLAPPVAAASIAALAVMREEPERVARLNANAALFNETARACGLDTGATIGAAIVPIMTGGSLRAALGAAELWRRGVNVQPIFHPAVPERLARLRFFISASHQADELVRVARLTAEVLEGIVVDQALARAVAASDA